MAQQGMPDLADLYAKSAKATRPIVVALESGQMDNSTPCKEWNVQQVLDHVLGGASMGAARIGGQENLGTEGSNIERYDASTAALAEAAGDATNLEKPVETPFGEMPGGQLLAGLAMDVFVHGWDLAKATGQDTSLDAELSGAYHAMFEGQMDMLRNGGATGPEVPVSADASIQDKLIGMMGRQP